VVIIGPVIVAYAWWVTGVAPFTSTSYVLVAVPWILAVVAYAREGYFVPRRSDVATYYRQRALGVTWSNTTAWLVIGGVAVVLEFVGLALGGHSNRVPTLSGAADHLLVTHIARCALFCAWIAVATWPLIRLRRWRDQGAA
jgi:hypothetical protein